MNRRGFFTKAALVPLVLLAPTEEPVVSKVGQLVATVNIDSRQVANIVLKEMTRQVRISHANV